MKHQATWMEGAATRTPSRGRVLSLSACPSPQVPIIPVVYSSFSSFYNVKTKLFTSGEPTRAAQGLTRLSWSLFLFILRRVHVPQVGLQLLR